jgi:cold shock CspA family protein
MAQRAIDWDVAPASDAPPFFDAELQPPVVLPIIRRRPTRHVGVVKLYAPAKTYGLVASPDVGDAIFNIDDVVPCDRAKLDCGQAVTFEVIDGPDGQTARHVRLDATDLPPPPDAALVSKGWR